MKSFSFSSAFIIAEAGVNHNGSLELAFKLVDAAIEVGANAIKFQTFKTEKILSKNVDKATYQKESTEENETQFEMIKKLELSYSDFKKIKRYCEEKGIIFLSTPDEEESLDFLCDTIEVPYIKVGSGEVTNYPFLKYIASKNKPVILSTGMSTIGEVEKAVNTMYSVNENLEIALLHCTTNYPTPYEEVNLRAMLTLKETFKLPVGYSDHTLGIEVPVAAVALGAHIIEKHLTLDKKLPGPDHKASMEPREFQRMVEAIRNIEKAMGDGIKRPNNSEKEIQKVVRRRLAATRHMESGEVVREKDIAIKRVSEGLLPEFFEIIVGKKLRKEIEKDNGFTWNHFMEE